MLAASSLADVEEFHVEEQRGVGRDDAASTARTVPEFGGNAQLTFAADFHSRDALLPALDYMASSDLKHEGLAAVHGAIEFLAVGGEPAGVVHGDRFPIGGGDTGAGLEVPVLNAGSGTLRLSLDLGGAGVIGLTCCERGDGEKRKKEKEYDGF
jgi:hypothetical protein